MIITRKAAVGFLLLAGIVFLTAQFTVDQFSPYQLKKSDREIRIEFPQQSQVTYSEKQVYNPPIVALGENAPLIITIVIELFALCCYLVLKKLEPAINKAAENFVNEFSDDQ
ncbi:MAG: hypothetical protein WC626_05410 [Methanoregula sp.]